MTVALPDDILHLLCAELSDQGEFDTLFACALSSKRLAVPALTALYRTQHDAPIKGGGSEGFDSTKRGDINIDPRNDRYSVIRKWSILWRTVILSSMGKTLFPYSKYIKVLDFRDLDNMLDDTAFRDQVSRTFFEGDLSKHKKMVRSKWSRGPRQVLDRISSVDSIGEVVTQQTPVAEQITGEILPSALVRWIPRLPRLRSLQLWDGAAVGDERIANLITVHCPGFDDLSIFRWDGDDTDHQLSVFMSGLPPNRLRGFETISQTGIAAESFLALSSHADSLKELKLHVNSDTLPHLGLLKGCNNLELFELEDANGNVDLEKMQNDVFLDMVVWLRDCHKLRTLSFAKFHSAAALLGQVLFNDKIHLEHLHLDSYVVKDQKTFHLALANQTTLTRLSLRGNSDLITYEDRSTFVESICQLKELRDLKLVFVSDDLDLLTDVEIAKLVRNLPDLEALFFTGYGVTDGVLDEISNLRALRSITFSAVTAFSVGGLLDFVNDLGPGNRGLQIYIDNADPDSGLTDEEQELVRTALWTKVGGRLEYQLLRDDLFEGESDSD